MSVQTAVSQLEQALDRLSWSPNRQLEHLQRFGLGPDELALDFDDSYRVVAALVSRGALPLDVAAPLQHVDSLLAEMTDGTDAHWTGEAVAQSPQWARLRRTSREALDSLRAAAPSDEASGRET
ncbi:hypothetical protein GTW43_24245 [Streptomyces sp. SID5785]|uniref:hypothetical protein n=1 Tax=Streptomyces sp. SID5785 TaxID=2690309 RepID=UPI001361D578|nr:hypothetical protein [Streptomyces sp. SID5785]MZD08172.1 hypothetical protein [Streptomyces sp. SID5785]